MDEIYKEVYFNEYCSSCKYATIEESEHPCCDCLEEPSNLYSHKPVYYEEINYRKGE